MATTATDHRPTTTTPATIDELLRQHRHELNDAIEGLRASHADLVKSVRESIREDAAAAVAEVEAIVEKQLVRDLLKDEPVIRPIFGDLPSPFRKALAEADLIADDGRKGYIVLTPRPTFGGNDREKKAFLLVDISEQVFRSEIL